MAVAFLDILGLYFQNFQKHQSSNILLKSLQDVVVEGQTIAPILHIESPQYFQVPIVLEYVMTATQGANINQLHFFVNNSILMFDVLCDKSAMDVLQSQQNISTCLLNCGDFLFVNYRKGGGECSKVHCQKSIFQDQNAL